MVFIKIENLHSANWILCRIVEVVLEKDKKSTVCRVKTKSSILKRTVTELALLPINTD